MPTDTTPVLYVEAAAEQSGMAIDNIPFRSVDALRGVTTAIPGELRAVGDALEWSLPGGLTDGWREGGPAEEVLFDFLWLSDATAESVLRFAKKYGVLGV